MRGVARGVSSEPSPGAGPVQARPPTPRLGILRRALAAGVALALSGPPPGGAREPRPPSPAPPAAATGFDALPEVIGEPSSDLVEAGDTLLDVAYRHRLGFDRVSLLNPDIKVWIPEPGTVVHLPTEHILPDAPHRGLVINVPEMQLYDYTVGATPDVYAIAIGDQMDPSLHGSYRVGRKRVDPNWYVPASIRAEKPELPAVVPAGPDNPLGDRWMTIGSTSYGIHGTNNPWSIGREATHGCIRLYNDEMRRLFAHVKEGTPIQLIYETVKIGRRGDWIYVSAFPDRYGRDPDRTSEALQRLASLGLFDLVDLGRVQRVIDQSRGTPVPVGTRFGPDLGTHFSEPAPDAP
jgi:L,D-transpeptidase ErfK/SrfK